MRIRELLACCTRTKRIALYFTCNARQVVNISRRQSCRVLDAMIAYFVRSAEVCMLVCTLHKYVSHRQTNDSLPVRPLGVAYPRTSPDVRRRPLMNPYGPTLRGRGAPQDPSGTYYYVHGCTKIVVDGNLMPSCIWRDPIVDLKVSLLFFLFFPLLTFC